MPREREARRVRVLQVTHDLGVGGLPRVVATLCAFIDREQFEVAVLCLNALGPLADELTSAGTPVQLLDQERRRPDYFAFLKVARLLRTERFDVVHTHNTQPFIDGGIGATLARVRTLVHTDHARNFPDKRRYIVAEHVLSHFAYRVVGVSEHTTANLRRYERIPQRKLLTIPNGIDARPYELPFDPTVKRQELGLSDGPVVGFAGRLATQKGVAYLLEAMRLLLRRFPRLTLLVAGEGPLNPDLRRTARELGVESSVKFLGVRPDMPELYRLLDVFVLPSLWEGLPMVVLEAMAAGCPVVASGVGGVPSVVEHESSGLLVPPQRPDQIATEVGRLLDSSELRERFRQAGRVAFKQRFSAESMARRYEDVYLRRV